MVRTETRNQPIDGKSKKMIEECFILGRIAEDSQNLPRLGDEFGKAVSERTVDGRHAVVFYVEPISKEPETLQALLGKTTAEVYITFDDKNKRYLERQKYFEQEDKVAFLRDHFENRLLLIKPILRFDSNHASRYHYNFEIVLDEKLDATDNPNFYVPIPTYTQSSQRMFESRLMSGKPIELTSYNHAMEIPEYILCGDYLYHIEDESGFSKYAANDRLYICEDPKAIRRINKPEGLDNLLRMSHKDISFAPLEETNRWVDVFNEKGVYIPDAIKKEKEINTQTSKKIVSEAKKAITDDVLVNESDFIQRLDYLAIKKKLRYSLDDLYNFHTALKSSNFTILGGMSGTGKTELALLYAEALKLQEGDNLMFIPVKPSFTEPSDLLGFLNPQTGVFQESDIGLASFLYKASTTRDKMFMVVFDEMNLGQVEHYFSDFISILELDKEKRTLRLFNKGANCVQPHLQEGIKILDNILFVGTANFDETTRDFSNRMLDRSNVILLEKLSFLEAQKYESEDIESLQDYETKERTKVNNPDSPITTDNFTSWIQNKKALSYLEEYELSILDSLHEEISNYDSQTGVSFRIAKQIAHYLENVPRDEDGAPFLDRNTAFDYQIKQRILPKIRGHKEQLEDLVGTYAEDYRQGRLAMILEGDTHTEKQAKYVKSISYLKQKAKELTRNGYTL